MKINGRVVGAGALAAAVAIYLAIRGLTPEPPLAPQPAPGPMQNATDQSAQLAAQVAELQRSLAAVRAEIGAQRRDSTGPINAVAASKDESKPLDLSVEEQRAADAGKRRGYMAAVGEAFSQEKVDSAWANQAAARVGAAFEKNEALRGISRSVECRQQTCRLQVNEEGARKLAGGMPHIALDLVDVLPSISAEHIDRGTGGSAMVLYLSRQSFSTGSPPKR
jgi:hypothetical protein